MIRPSVIVLFLAFVGCLSADEIRTWTDSTGKHKREGEFVSVEGGKVVIKSSQGKLIRIPLSKLSKPDQELVRTIQQERKEKAANNSSTKTKTPNFAQKTVNSVRSAPLRTESMNKLKQIAIALISYESARGRFPTSGKVKGNSGLSWRVAILPQLGEQVLYRQFRHNEPWDSPHNKKLIDRMPSVYRSPGGSDDPGITNYLGVVHASSIIVPDKRGVRIADIRDGASKTIIVVEADDTVATTWTKPDDLEWDPDNPTKGLGHIWAGGQFLGAYADGAVGRFYTDMGNETISALFTRNGGERVEFE